MALASNMINRIVNSLHGFIHTVKPPMPLRRRKQFVDKSGKESPTDIILKELGFRVSN